MKNGKLEAIRSLVSERGGMDGSGPSWACQIASILEEEDMTDDNDAVILEGLLEQNPDLVELGSEFEDACSDGNCMTCLVMNGIDELLHVLGHVESGEEFVWGVREEKLPEFVADLSVLGRWLNELSLEAALRLMPDPDED